MLYIRSVTELLSGSLFYDFSMFSRLAFSFRVLLTSTAFKISPCSVAVVFISGLIFCSFCWMRLHWLALVLLSCFAAAVPSHPRHSRSAAIGSEQSAGPVSRGLRFRGSHSAHSHHKHTHTASQTSTVFDVSAAARYLRFAYAAYCGNGRFVARVQRFLTVVCRFHSNVDVCILQWHERGAAGRVHRA